MFSIGNEFSEAVESGAKRQSVRAFRRDGLDPVRGDRLHLWTGPYDHRRRKIGEAIVSNTQTIMLLRDHKILALGDFHKFYGPRAKGVRKFALADGFESVHDLFAYFEKRGGFPVAGLLIRWGDIENRPEVP